MTEPRIIPLGCQSPNLEAQINEAVSLRPDASAQRPAPEEDHDGHEAHVALEAAEAGAMTAELAHGLGAASTAGATVASPFVSMFGYYCLIDHAYSEGDRQNLIINNEMHRGALAALEGRIDAPEVRARAAESPAFADGMRRVVDLFHRDPAKFRALALTAQASIRGGMLAVARGEADTKLAAERMEHDPAFAHGVQYMGGLRDRDPEAFARKAEYLEGLASEVEGSRYCQVRG